MTALSFLNSSNYRIYNMEAAHKLGSIHASIFLSELINRQEYHQEQQQDTFLEFEDKRWFYYTHDKGVERLAMSRKEQDTAIKILIKHGLIKKIQKGVPAKRYFWIDEDAVLELFGLSKKDSSLTDSDKLDCPKGADWNDPNGQTGLYNKEPYKEPHKDIDATPPVPPKPIKPSQSKKKERKPNVFITDEEHEKLLKKYESEQFVEACYEELSSWKESADPKTVAKHSSDYRRITKWVARDVKEQLIKDGELEARKARLEKGTTFVNAEKEVMIEENMKFAEEQIKKIKAGKGGQIFGIARAWDTWCEVKVNGNWTRLTYTENGFREQFINLLRKGGHI